MAKSQYQFKKRQKELVKKKTRPLQQRTGRHTDRPAPIAGAMQW